LTIFDRAAEPTCGFCPKCFDKVPMLDLDAAATIYGKPVGMLLEGISTGDIHSIENANGHLRICRNSLL